MQYVIFVFSNRAGAMALYDYCRRHRLTASIVNTPREVSASCGISVRAETRLQGYIQRAASQIATYVGTYLVQTNLGRHSIMRLQD